MVTPMKSALYEDNLDDNGAYQEHNSMGGPIQAGQTTSGLPRRSSFYDDSGEALMLRTNPSLTM